MAVPYIWATYEVLIESSTEILVVADKRRMTQGERRRGMMGRHDYLGLVTGSPFGTDDLVLIDLVGTSGTASCTKADWSTPTHGQHFPLQPRPGVTAIPAVRFH